MRTGMLWFDASAKPLSEKIAKAVAYYKQKYNRQPNVCLVHPNALNGNPPSIEGVRVRPYRPVLPHHIWVGMDEPDRAKTKGE